MDDPRVRISLLFLLDSKHKKELLMISSPVLLFIVGVCRLPPASTAHRARRMHLGLVYAAKLTDKTADFRFVDLDMLGGDTVFRKDFGLCRDYSGAQSGCAMSIMRLVDWKEFKLDLSLIRIALRAQTTGWIDNDGTMMI